jgi:hypothetical protein
MCSINLIARKIIGKGLWKFFKIFSVVITGLPKAMVQLGFRRFIYANIGS